MLKNPQNILNQLKMKLHSWQHGVTQVWLSTMDGGESKYVSRALWTSLEKTCWLGATLLIDYQSDILSTWDQSLTHLWWGIFRPRNQLHFGRGSGWRHRRIHLALRRKHQTPRSSNARRIQTRFFRRRVEKSVLSFRDAKLAFQLGKT